MKAKQKTVLGSADASGDELGNKTIHMPLGVMTSQMGLSVHRFDRSIHVAMHALSEGRLIIYYY
eukprot:scaffold660020_cov57-Prasinocladus_malaysianus.AAC.1